VSIIGNHFHTAKSYLRNNILAGTPGHKGYSEKTLTVLETARLCFKDKKLNVFVHTQKKDFCELYWKKEGMEQCCQR
jgi:sulfate adenylyltransferase subunit 1 (EFTu-like GTPase family)